jgi:hypothetical protein
MSVSPILFLRSSWFRMTVSKVSNQAQPMLSWASPSHLNRQQKSSIHTFMWKVFSTGRSLQCREIGLLVVTKVHRHFSVARSHQRSAQYISISFTVYPNILKQNIHHLNDDRVPDLVVSDQKENSGEPWAGVEMTWCEFLADRKIGRPNALNTFNAILTSSLVICIDPCT